MSEIAKAYENLAKAANHMANAQRAIDGINKALEVESRWFNKQRLKREKGFTDKDIASLPAFYPKGKKHPVFQQNDVEQYIRSRSTSPE